MYKVVTKEDTIRIPAEYMRKGQSLDQHIDRLSMDAFEGKFDAENRFVLVAAAVATDADVVGSEHAAVAASIALLRHGVVLVMPTVALARCAP